MLKENGHDSTHSYALCTYEQGPLDPDDCTPTSDGERCIDGPIELLPVNPFF